VNNTYVNNDPLFARPERYSFNVRHAQHPLEQFTPHLREQLKELIPGPDKNAWGKVSYDVPGTAAGSWFLESAPKDEEVFTTSYVHTQLFLGELAYAPDTRIINVGTAFEKEGEQPVRMVLGVEETDWENITPSKGLVQLKIYNITREAEPGTKENGSLLLEMLDEWFNTHAGLTVFTEDARIYIR